MCRCLRNRKSFWALGQDVKNLEFSGSIYNLFDKKYHDPASPDFSQDLNPQDGRTFRVKLTYKF